MERDWNLPTFPLPFYPRPGGDQEEAEDEAGHGKARDPNQPFAVPGTSWTTGIWKDQKARLYVICRDVHVLLE